MQFAIDVHACQTSLFELLYSRSHHHSVMAASFFHLNFSPVGYPVNTVLCRIMSWLEHSCTVVLSLSCPSHYVVVMRWVFQMENVQVWNHFLAHVWEYSSSFTLETTLESRESVKLGSFSGFVVFLSFWKQLHVVVLHFYYDTRKR
jgi:hypothetical protein